MGEKEEERFSRRFSRGKNESRGDFLHFFSPLSLLALLALLLICCDDDDDACFIKKERLFTHTDNIYLRTENLHSQHTYNARARAVVNVRAFDRIVVVFVVFVLLSAP